MQENISVQFIRKRKKEKFRRLVPAWAVNTISLSMAQQSSALSFCVDFFYLINQIHIASVGRQKMCPTLKLEIYSAFNSSLQTTKLRILEIRLE